MRLVDPGSTSGVAAILVADLEHLAREWTVVVMATTERLGVKPDARSAVKRTSALLPGSVIGMEFGDEIGTLALESIPSRFPDVFKYMIERGPGNDHAACATTVARLDDGQRLRCGAHDGAYCWKARRENLMSDEN
jgi:hypothetical protein